MCIMSGYVYNEYNESFAGGRPKMFVVLVMSYAPNGDLFSKLERAHKEQRHIPEETIRVSLVVVATCVCLCMNIVDKLRRAHERQ
jgi:hypothetical protein